jgi:hypothetical protein
MTEIRGINGHGIESKTYFRLCEEDHGTWVVLHDSHVGTAMFKAFDGREYSDVASYDTVHLLDQIEAAHKQVRQWQGVAAASRGVWLP